eukprot:GILJ01004374.1.p1 GENE.GILJ01004374.1~~GILJ01004374.1.p1  ORF type:complete len:568 (+),score=59.41 GILJ01004374.1:49-1752(+)
MTKLILRLHTRAGRARLEAEETDTLSSLQEKIAAQVGVPPSEQVIAKNEAGTDVLSGGSKTLRALGLANGSILHLIQRGAAASVPTIHPTAHVPVQRQLTAKCTHGPTGACANCMGPASEDVTKDEKKPSRCTHGPAAKCANCIEDGDAKAKEVKGHCTHGPNAKCPNCLGVSDEQMKETKSACTHGPHARCPNCLEDNFIKSAKHKSFEQYLAEKRVRCADHPAEEHCVNCVPPREQRYTLKPNCPYHKPWPHGVCNKCMPATATLARQEYRHVDYIQFMNLQEFNNFVGYWTSMGMTQQRIGFMYGYYSEDPNYPDGVRAVVEAIYEPPQLGDTSGVRLLADRRKGDVDRIAEELGLEKVGWIFTALPRDYFLSSQEVREAARFQNEFSVEHPTGYMVTKFVTVVVKQDTEGHISPDAYMVSDQCQALERDNVLGESDNPKLMVERKAEHATLLPTIMANGAPTESFDPDWFLVNVNSGAPQKPRTFFKHSDFARENRRTQPSPADVKAFLNKYRSEPFHERLSDFHLLVYLAQMLDIDTALVLCRSVADKTPVSQPLQDLLGAL